MTEIRLRGGRLRRSAWHALPPSLALGAVLLLGSCTPAAAPPPADSGQGSAGAHDQTAALQTAVDSGNLAAAQAAVAAGADANARFADQTPLLVRAVKNEDTSMAALLVKAGADVNAKDPIQDSAFLYAGAEGLDEILELAIAHGADVASTNRYGGTALIPAAEHGHIETIKILLGAGVPVDHINNLGWTALREAIVLGDGGPEQVEAVRLLLAGGADPGIRDGNGVSPRDLAARQGYTEIANLLDEHFRRQ
ncbi:ankyrin repeat domain-containing protein [Glutamicibacter protophormiae]|uniref:ankyrin repeat domain-containing protein n=1 Tax=Glutamicibacter protophormiae TaxID=37930 RepID=UPI002A818E55|nr:ankyrin repeat domain-containing protein [Glutamicibacter protophormiae]WPR64631.1 ankyrin repeat domain-containing protein [Glutamicibacter protophormiae]WPR68127.1 ankyrin repeat domain-containing protein [Glutamicibacter protophormiae]